MSLRLQIVTRSLWVYPVSSGGCNNCLVEILDCLSPNYDLERFGVTQVFVPKQADALLVTGSMTQKNVQRMKRIFQQMQKPAVVAAVGTCALGQGVFQGSYMTSKTVDAVLPVEIYIPGCPPKPEAVIAGLGKLVKLIRQRI